MPRSGIIYGDLPPPNLTLNTLNAADGIDVINELDLGWGGRDGRDLQFIAAATRGGPCPACDKDWNS